MKQLCGGVAAFCTFAIAIAVGHAQTPPTLTDDYEHLAASWDQEPLPATPRPDPVPTALTLPPSVAAPTTTPTSVVPASVTMVHGPTPCVTCGSACVGSCSVGAYPAHSFWFADLELTILEPSYDNGIFALDGDDSIVAPRLYFGWESARGLGLRTRFWWLNDKLDFISELPMPPDADQVKFQARRFDFEAYRRFVFDESSLAVGAGITAAGINWEIDPAQMEDAGGGVSFFVEGRHQLWRTPVSKFGVVARGRWASIIGNWEGDLGGRDRGDLTMEILEVAFGWDLVREFSRCDFLFQTLVEAQTWQSTLTGDVGFLGQTLSAGWRW
jgi:ferredoxin